jgi:hypothetical protein
MAACKLTGNCPNLYIELDTVMAAAENPAGDGLGYGDRTAIWRVRRGENPGRSGFQLPELAHRAQRISIYINEFPMCFT